jgi:glucose/arabinose dehydrogenase
MYFPKNISARVALLALGTATMIGGCRSASAAPADAHQLLTGKAALGDWQTDAPGVRRHITVSDLPAPYATPSANNDAHVVPRPDGAFPQAPAGFQVQLYASGLNQPRKIVTAPNGDLFVAESGPGRIHIFRGMRPDGRYAQDSIFATGLELPFGIAFYPSGPHPRYVYIGNTGSVVRFPYQNGDLQARGPAETIVPDIPSGGHLRGGGHWTRDVVLSRDGRKMFVSVGSLANIDDDPPSEYHRADILEYYPDGTDFHLYASGIRNPVGLAIDPKTGQLWTSVNERDQIGDLLPPDYITHVQDGGFYGWPWYYIGNHPDPRLNEAHPELASHVIVPDVLLQAHSASLCLTFYTGQQFPKAYQGQIFAAEHGSWNRANRTGYKVILVPLKNGKATGEYDDFLTGFVTPSGDVWGRPVGVTVGNSGSLFVTDDGSGSIWRVSYSGKDKSHR